MSADIGESRQAFMARVRMALKRSGTVPPQTEAPRIDESIVRLVAKGAADLPTVFTQAATDVGMKVHPTTSSGAPALVVSLLRAAGARRVISSLDSSPATAALHAHVGSSGFEVTDWKRAPGFGAQYDADAGLTGVEAAVAESGTLVCTSGPGRGRGLSLVPPVHIAVVRASQIVPDLVDFWTSGLADLRRLPSSVVLITGPSKTADIEGVLITGVHGPREVHVVLVGDA